MVVEVNEAVNLYTVGENNWLCQILQFFVVEVIFVVIFVGSGDGRM